MERRRILTVFGTRPEAIKMAPLVLELKKRTDLFETVVCVSGQHREMLQQVLEVFGIEPDYDLEIMKPGQTLTDITTEVLLRLGGVLEEVKPDILLVHGDTTTSFAAALAAFYRGIPIGHVEAGLRTYNLRSPFPEEFNRQGTGLLADFHFAPTQKARENLLKEGKRPERIFVTGNTAIDALRTTVRDDYGHPLLDWVDGHPLILLTAHRRENLGAPMREAFLAIRRVLVDYPDLRLIYPVHKNPLVQKIAMDVFCGSDQVRLVPPLDVLDFHNLMARSHLILTDSGGIQEEAPALGKPVIVMRDTTERPEGVEAGTLLLAGNTPGEIEGAFRRLLEDPILYERMSMASNPYGDGWASSRIATILEGTSWKTASI